MSTQWALTATSLLFTAHTAGEKAGAVGVVANDVVRAYRYPSRGIHDIVIHDDGIMFTDSFRDSDAAENPDVSGAIRFRGKEYLSQALATVAGSRKLVLRGLGDASGNVRWWSVSALSRRGVPERFG